MKPDALIFDMDGTLVDNNPYHVKAWKQFYKVRGRELSMDDYTNNINGRVAHDIFKYIFQKDVTREEAEAYIEEKEALYRQLYLPHAKEIEGLKGFLKTVYNAGIPMAIATSGVPVNIKFLFEHVDIKKFFKKVIDSTQITNGKPHPEIFLKAAASVNANPEKCVAFEDSVSGIAAAKAAGMRVVALTTMQEREYIIDADIVIDDYTQLTLGEVESLLDI